MRIAFGSDHAGFEPPEPLYKPSIINHLKNREFEVVDCGPDGPGAVDYPDIAKTLAEAVLEGRADLGVLLCGTGIGISMGANRHEGIRAAVCTNAEMVKRARAHNNANVLCQGRRVLTLEEAIALVDIFLDTPFSGEERHQRRVDKLG